MKNVLAAIFLSILSLSVLAQSRTRYSEFGAGIGTMNALTEISNTNNTSALLAETGLNFSIYGMKHVNDWFALGLDISYAGVNMSDANHSNPSRGISNTTNMWQFNPYIQMHFIRFGKYHTDRKFTFYVKAGFGGLIYNPDPSAIRFDDNIELKPDSYSSINYFGGLGLKIRTSLHSSLSLEYLRHNSGTDFLEGIIDSDLPSNGNDSYGGIQLRFSYLLLEN